MDTVEPIVTLSEGEPPPSRPRWRKGVVASWILGALVVVVVGGVIASMTIKVDYVILAPGHTYSTKDRIALGQGGPKVYPPAGTIDFVTVSEDDDVTAFERFEAQRNPDDLVVRREQIFGNQTQAQNNASNQFQMRAAKDTSAIVALRKLGYKVPTVAVGAGVVQVEPGQSAEKAGLKPGDTIVAVDGAKVFTGVQLRDRLAEHRPGDVVTLTVQHVDRSAPVSLKVTLGTRPDAAAKAFLGVSTTDVADPQLPFSVNIRTDDVGGPSAGLAFTLGVLDALTPGELTGGQEVAVTGEIFEDGTVGPIGGIEQKVATVAKAHIGTFLVPADRDCGKPNGSCNFTDATRKAAGKVQIIPVEKLDDALVALAGLGGNALTMGTPGATS